MWISIQEIKNKIYRKNRIHLVLFYSFILINFYALKVSLKKKILELFNLRLLSLNTLMAIQNPLLLCN